MPIPSQRISPRPQTDPALNAVLKRLREEQKLSMPQLAEKAKLTTPAYSRIEQGKASPGWWTVRHLADALGVSLRDLAAKVEAEK